MKKEHHTIMYKPSCDCNLNCKYCYDKPMRDRYHGIVASKEILEHTAKLMSNYAHNIQWYFHGGEPTLLGHDYYYDAQNVFSQYHDTVFDQALQSNGILPMADRRWIDTMKDCGIGMGFSFDLYGQSTRLGKEVDITGKYEEMLEDFRDSGARDCVETVSVITSKTINKLIDTYEHFKQRFGGEYVMSLLLVFEIDESHPTGLGISEDEYVKYYPEYLHHVFTDTSHNAIIDRYINSYLTKMLGFDETSQCGFIECRRKWLAVNPDGTVTHCDREPGSYYRLGNILDYESIDDIYNSPLYAQFEADCEERLTNFCRKCTFYHICNGGCHSNHGAVNNTRVNLVNKRECYTLQQNILSMYDELQKIEDINTVNSKLSALLKDHYILLPVEIYQYLSANNLGYSKYLDINSIRNTPDKFITSINYRLFKLFNDSATESPDTRIKDVFKSNKDYIEKLVRGETDEI